MWAIEQDELSKRSIPTSSAEGSELNSSAEGRDVFVPWVLAQSQEAKPKGRQKGKRGHQDAPDVTTSSSQQKVFDRYYHMFANGELHELVVKAASDMGLVIGDAPAGGLETGSEKLGVQIVQDGWERSNYYVELRRWVQ